MSDREFVYLTSLGYTGTLADKRRAYYDDLILNGGEPDIPITAEYVPNRDIWTSSAAATVNQRINLTYFTAKNTETITTITAYTGGTAAGATPTRCQYCIYSVDSNDDLTLITQTTNDTALFANTFTAYPKALDASWSKVAGRRYAAGILVVTGATAPQFLGHIPIASVMYGLYANKPRLSSNLTGQSTLPSSILNSSVAATGTRIAFYLNG